MLLTEKTEHIKLRGGRDKTVEKEIKGPMVKEEIRIKKAIVHIMDFLAGMPVLSDGKIDFGSELLIESG